jgi:peptidoglycan/LPS O-acetylase OafA/YrhL
MDSLRAAHQDFLRTRFFGGLDGLRALSIVAVILYHTAQVHQGVVGRLYLGVSLFFAISGFLITTLLLRERESTGTVSLAGFYARRSLRIFPLYYAVVGVCVLRVALTETDLLVRAEFFQNLPAFLTYTSNWFVPLRPEGRVIFYFAWSLATEEQFYLLWPWVMRYARGAGAVVLMGGLLGVALVVPWAAGARYLDSNLLWVRILASFSVPICMGCLAAHLAHWERGFGGLYRVLGQGWSAPVVMGLMVGVVCWEGAPHALSALVLTAMVVSICLRPRTPLSPVLEHPWVRYVGTVSYGMYLMHMLALKAVRKAVPESVVAALEAQLGGWAVVGVYFLLGTALSVLLAGLSFRHFESRFLELKKRFDWRQEKDSARPVEGPSASPG